MNRLQFADVGPRGSRRGVLGGLAFEIEAQFAHLDVTLRVHDGDRGRSVIDLRQRLVRHQPGQRLAHRGDADAESVRHVSQFEFLPGLVATGHQLVAKLLVDLCAETILDQQILPPSRTYDL